MPTCQFHHHCKGDKKIHHQIPEIEIPVHFGHFQYSHIIKSTRRSNRQLILTLWSPFLLGKILEPLSKLGQEGDIRGSFRGGFGVFVIDLGLSVPLDLSGVGE